MTRVPAPAIFAAALVLLASCSSARRQRQRLTRTRPRSWQSAPRKRAYNAGDAAAVAALYTNDAVLSAPGEPPIRGNAAISEYFVRKVAEFSTARVTVEDAPFGDAVASGDLAWQWRTYRVVDQSGAVVDAGKLVTLFRRKNGKWLIAGDTWNSDAMPGASTRANQQ